MNSQRAAVIPEKLGQISVVTVERYAPGKGEILIKNHAVATNPIDYAMQKAGIMLTKYPAIIGNDLAGVVEEVGDGVTKFKKGDRVFSLTQFFITGFEARYAAFQEYTISTEQNTGLIPSNVSFEQASTVPLVFATAVSGLYVDLGLTPPTSAKTKPAITSSSPILYVNGAASGVGAAAVQLGVLSGFRVIATSSPKNFDLIKSFGASDVFDYNDAQLVQKVRDAAGTSIPYAFDAISKEGSVEKAAAIIGEQGSLVTVFPGATFEGIKVKKASGTLGIGPQKEPHLISWFYPFMTEGLASGTLVGLKADVIGHGLEDLQKVLDHHASGKVSAAKPVLKLD